MNATWILENVTAYALQAGLLVSIGAALPALVGLRNGRAPAARLLYWQALLAGCLALPWIRPWQTEVVAISRATLAAAPAAPVDAMAVTAPHALPSPATVALWLLGAGAALRLLWLAFGFLKLARHRRGGAEMPLPPEWSGMAGGAAVLISDEMDGPVTFGLFRPVVLLPASFPSLPKTMRDAILSHELLHVARRDWAFTLAEELVRAAFWFHPAIWWVLGEIQLAREQTVDRCVIEMTQARDPYVDTLLAMAGAPMEPDLAPAPSFLRRRHLKQRVIGLIQETNMSKTRTLLAQAAALSLMASACWLITAAVPLRAQAQTVMDGPGVTVNLNSAQLLHRPALHYPASALAKGVEGTVVVQVRLDANGEVIDDAILSGPDEFRREVQQAVLNWHFESAAGASTRVVNITFSKPPEPAASTVAMVPMTAAMPANAVRLPANPGPNVKAVIISGLPDAASDRLRAELPVRVGDTYTPDLRRKTLEAARQFDEHLLLTENDAAGDATLRIVAPDASSGAARIGSSVMAANLINAVRPVYPPLAKMARQQGTVKLEATVGADGAVEDLKVLSGPPLLIQAAVNAVRNWVYRPTLLNGVPSRVSTTVDVNFSLSNSFPGAQ
jgi:TonB family protein